MSEEAPRSAACECVSSRIIARAAAEPLRSPLSNSGGSRTSFSLCDDVDPNGDCNVRQAKDVRCPDHAQSSDDSRLVHNICSCRCQHSKSIRFLRGSRVICRAPLDASAFCELRVIAGGDVVLEGGVDIEVSTLVVNATRGGIRMDAGSWINTTAKGLFHRSAGRQALNGSGGSYGGIGGQAECGGGKEDPGTGMLGFPDVPWHNWVTDVRGVLEDAVLVAA